MKGFGWVRLNGEGERTLYLAGNHNVEDKNQRERKKRREKHRLCNRLDAEYKARF